MTAIANLVHQQTTTSGTGPYTLTSVNGRQTFDLAFGHGATTNVFYVFMMSQTAAEYMWAKAHLSAANTLVIDTVLGGSNGTSAVNFSAGTIDVTNALPAARIIYSDDTSNTSLPKQLSVGSSLYPSIGGFRYDTSSAAIANTLGAKTVLAGVPAIDGSTTWLNTFLSGIDVKDTVAVYGTSTNGLYGGAFASRGSDNPTANANIIGAVAVAIHDNTSVDQLTWGGYTLGVVASTAHGGNHINHEHTIYNQKTAVKVDPFNVNPAGAVTGIRVDSGNGGGGISGPAPTSCSNAHDIVNNGAPFLSGIVFQSTSLDTAADANPDAIALPPAYAFSWYSAAATRLWQMYSSSGANGNLNVVTPGTGQLTVLAPGLQVAKNVNSGVSISVNNQNSGSSTSANLLLTSDAGTFKVGVGSAAAGAAGQFLWNGGTMLFDAQNASALMKFRTGTTPSDAMSIDANQNVVIGKGSALATSATNGFFYPPSCAGTPTGTPTAKTGSIPLVYDTTANKLWAYNGAWKSVALA